MFKALLLFKKGKPRVNNTIVYAVFIILLTCSFLISPPSSFTESTDKYYLKLLGIIKENLVTLKKMGQNKAPLHSLQQQFFRSRSAYKKAAILIDYFNLYESKLLNGPPLDHVEEDTPDKIIAPEGFQVIEQLLFSDWKPTAYPVLITKVNAMIAAITQIEKEPERASKFKEELVWDALRSSLVRLMAHGITGSDSQVAQFSLQEGVASIEGMKNILGLFKNRLNGKDEYSFLILLNTAQAVLKKNISFNTFDRLSFITKFIAPLYKKTISLRTAMGLSFPQGRNPVHPMAASLFTRDAFDINFFSPAQEYFATPGRIELGKKLFSDNILSGSKDRSCATCHRPEKAFTDGLSVPLALDNKTSLKRNTPTLWNAVFQTRQFFDSRADILEDQLDAVVHNVEEMKGSLKKSVDDLKRDPVYDQLFHKAYAGEKDPLTTYTIANAISSYVRSLVSLNSRFDQYMNGDRATLSPAEKNGFNIFAGKGKCATCHFIPLFNGLLPPEFIETESEVLGVPATKNKNPAQLDADQGKFLFTTAAVDRYAFKTPTLRNIELTAPYMHNGVYSTLEEVMDFYNKGGGNGLKIAPPNQTLPFDKLNLSKKEISDVIAFLKTLTDTGSNK